MNKAIKKRLKNSELVADWYEVKEVLPNLFCVDEQDHVAFFVLKDSSKALFIDSGLGLSEDKAKQLLHYFGINQFDVFLTHAHCDHVGLNCLADKVYISEQEWNKFLKQKEGQQIQYYFEAMKNKLPWPENMDKGPKQKKWSPTEYVKMDYNIIWGPWSLKPLYFPGHTEGHLVFQEHRTNAIFLGDLIVSGANFLNLKDSSVFKYIESLKKLLAIIQNDPGQILLPAHDKIPLEAEYVQKMLDVIDAIRKKLVPSPKKWLADSVFEEGCLYESDGIRIVIRADQLKELQEQRR